MKITADITEHCGGGEAHVTMAVSRTEKALIELDGNLMMIKAANAVAVLINAIVADLFAEETDNVKADAFTALVGEIATDTRHDKDTVSEFTIRRGTE